MDDAITTPPTSPHALAAVEMNSAAFDALALRVVQTLDGLSIRQGVAVLVRAEELMLAAHTVDGHSPVIREALEALQTASDE